MDAIVLSLATNSAYVLEIILVKCMGYYFSICALKCLVNALRAQKLAGGHFLGHEIRLVFVSLSI